MIQLPSVPQYILESSISLMTFYAIFYLMLRKDTFHHFNKYYLLSTALISILLPFIDFHMIEAAQEAPGNIESLIQYRADLKHYESGISNDMFYTITISDILKGIFYIGVFLTALKFMFSFFQLLDKVKRKTVNTVSNNASKTFLGTSLFTFLYWNEDVEGEIRKPIIKSNASTIRPWHSIDVIIMELLVVLNWLNP